MQILTGDDAIGALVPRWNALWDADPTASAFARFEYLFAHRFVFGGPEPSAVLVDAGGEPAGCAAFAVSDGVLAPVLDPEVTDYIAPLARPGTHDLVAEGLVESFGGIDGWHEAVLPCLAADTPWPDAFSRAAKAAGYAVSERQMDVCPRVAVGGSWDGYLASLDGKLRHEIKRKARKLERDAGPYRIRLTERDRIAEDLEAFFALHRTSDGHKGRFMHWGMEGLFNLLVRSWDQLGWLRFVWLEVAGEPWAAILGWSARGTWNLYNSAFDSNRRELGPGMVLTGELIRLAAEEGCATVDFLRGAEPYKYRFGAVDVPLTELRLRREGTVAAERWGEREEGSA